VKRASEGYWLWIIFSAACWERERIGRGMIPTWVAARDVPGFGRRSRIQNLDIQILDNPSAGIGGTGELYFEQRNFEGAGTVTGDLRAKRFPHAFYLRAKRRWDGRFCGGYSDLE